MLNPTAKNTAFMTISSVGQKVVSFVYFTLIARMIGAEGMGKYFLALSFTTIFVVFVDLGFSNVLVRESAKYKDKAQEYFSNVLAVKFFLGLFTYIALLITVNILEYSTEVKNLIYLSGVTMLFDSLHLSIYSIFRAFGKLKYEAIGIVGSQILTLLMGSFFLFSGYPLIFLILAFTIPSFINVCFAAVFLYREYKIKLLPKYNKKIFLYLGSIAIPFGLAAIFSRVYTYIDSVMLSKMAGEAAVGWYSIPHKIVQAFLFIPGALVAVIYPRFSELFIKDKKRLAYVFERSFKYLLIIAMPIAVGIVVLAKDIIVHIFTEEYLNSVLPLQILIVGLIFSFTALLIGSFLNACNRQVAQTTIAALVMVVNIVLNLILIPIYGIVGAAISALVGNILLVKIGYLLIPKITRLSHTYILKNIIKLGSSSIAMGLIVWIVNMHYNFISAIVVGILVYPIMLVLTNAINKSQIKEAFEMIKK
ncbi:MAG: oligosaccharide flippase family protein [Candidatus Magasanikbacteria bacterium]|nr:oligosaccharide flippase family protein [Candidatus Magasanikbacteria bacterium]